MFSICACSLILIHRTPTFLAYNVSLRHSVLLGSALCVLNIFILRLYHVLHDTHDLRVMRKPLTSSRPLNSNTTKIRKPEILSPCSKYGFFRSSVKPGQFKLADAPLHNKACINSFQQFFVMGTSLSCVPCALEREQIESNRADAPNIRSPFKRFFKN